MMDGQSMFDQITFCPFHLIPSGNPNKAGYIKNCAGHA